MCIGALRERENKKENVTITSGVFLEREDSTAEDNLDEDGYENKDENESQHGQTLRNDNSNVDIELTLSLIHI